MSPIFARLPYYTALGVGLIGALFLGAALGSDDYLTVILSAASLFSAIWIIMSGERWWVPMGFALGIGGFFTIPWKLYPHELALALCGLAILPRIPFKSTGLKKKRPRLPAIFYVLFAYLLAHFAFSASRELQSGGLGNISRAYLNALWPFIFGLAFYLYGSSKVIGAAFRAMYLALLIRMAFGFTNYFLDDNFIVPIVNYTIDPQDLRTSGSMLLILSGLLVISSPGPIARVGHAFVMLASAYACLVGGSRAQIAAIFLYPMILCIVFRKWTQLLVSLSLAGLLVVAINLTPQTLESLPYRVQRGLSVLIIGTTVEIDVQQDVKGSDEFRRVISLEGKKRWTESPRNLLFGAGIRRFDESFFAAASRFEMDPFTLLIQSAADVGAYETTLWTLLGVLGLFGLVLYALLLLSLLRSILPALQTWKLKGANFVVVAWACLAIISAFFTCVLFGSYPSFEIFLAILAKGLVEDLRMKSVPLIARTVSTLPSITLPKPEPAVS
jgi:hypothetical protein